MGATLSRAVTIAPRTGGVTGIGNVTRSLNTRGLDRGGREAAYAEAISRSLDTEFLGPGCDADFIGFNVGALHVIRLDASPRISTRTARLIARDRHDGVSFQFAVEGTSVGAAGRRSVASDPGTVMILDFDQPFTMSDAGRRVVINVAVPRRLLRPRLGDPSGLHGLVFGAPAINLFRDLLLSVVEDQARISAVEARRIEAMILDSIEIMLDRGGVGNRPSGDMSSGPLLARALLAIDSRIGSPDLTPDWLGGRLGLSRTRLYRLFEASGGVSKAIWQRRLDAARAALVEPGDARRIGEIAYALGFSSEAHFARAFKARFGVTARDLRVSRRGTGNRD